MNQSIKLIAVHEDKTGAKVNVKHCNSLAACPVEVMSFYYKYKSKLLEDGFGTSAIGIGPQQQAIYIEIENKVVGHIIFEYIDKQKRTWIELSAVDIDYRRRGLYKIMHSHFEELSKKLGAVEISSFIHINNQDRLRSAESVGFLPKFYRMSKYI
jgi:CRISPR/Cas system-associated exonuclease Cas4 (RecB family)